MSFIEFVMRDNKIFNCMKYINQYDNTFFQCFQKKFLSNFFFIQEFNLVSLKIEFNIIKIALLFYRIVKVLQQKVHFNDSNFLFSMNTLYDCEKERLKFLKMNFVCLIKAHFKTITQKSNVIRNQMLLHLLRPRPPTNEHKQRS